MTPSESLKHTKWECKYHVVWIHPKYRKKSMYKDLRSYLGELLKDLASQKECRIVEGHLVSDHVHILIGTVGKDEDAVREYIRHQEEEDKRIDQLNLF